MSWISAGLVVLIGRGSLSAITGIPIKSWVFPVSAPWFTETEETLWNIGGILALIAAFVVLIWCFKLWRYIVVRKLNWMTDEEVDEFLIRGGDKPAD